MIQPTLDSIKAKVEKVFAICQREDYEILYNNAVVDCDEALYELCADPETLTLSVSTRRCMLHLSYAITSATHLHSITDMCCALGFVIHTGQQFSTAFIFL
jgi:hypothetical protein